MKTIAICVLAAILTLSPKSYPQENGDVNCDNKRNISDAVFLVNYIFAGGTSPCTINSTLIPSVFADYLSTTGVRQYAAQTWVEILSTTIEVGSPGVLHISSTGYYNSPSGVQFEIALDTLSGVGSLIKYPMVGFQSGSLLSAVVPLTRTIRVEPGQKTVFVNVRNLDSSARLLLVENLQLTAMFFPDVGTPR